MIGSHVARLRTTALVLALTLSPIAGCSFFQDFDFTVADASAGDGATDAARDASPDSGTDGGVQRRDGGNDAGSPSDAGTPLTEGEFREQLYDKFCAKLLACESKLGFGVLLEVLCHPFLADEFPVPQLVFRPEVATFHRPTAMDCLDSLDEPSCNLLGGVLEFDNASACARVFQGTLAPGESCLTTAECREGFCLEMDGCGGVCEAWIEEGGSCADDRRDGCAPGLTCRSSDDTCQPLVSEDDPCSRSSECGALLWCDNSANSCQPLPGSGHACQTSLGFDPCQAGLLCVSSTCQVPPGENEPCLNGRCGTGLRCLDDTCEPIAGPGQPCDTDDQCPSGGEPLFVCPAGTCEPAPVLGEPCNPLRPCLLGACVEDTCQELTAGDSCMEDRECEGGCDSGTCVAPLSAGEACSSNLECGDGLLCIGGDCTECGLADLIVPIF
jgi:hypothetical protein